MKLSFCFVTLPLERRCNKMSNNNLLGELRIMDDFHIKPNYSELARKYKIDRHTIKKYHFHGKIPDRKKVSRKSKWDKYYDEILFLMSLPGTTKMSVYQALYYQNNNDLPGDYSSFKAYTWRKNLQCRQTDMTPHVLYETDPGEQLQADWKEGLQTHSKDGTLYKYNVFSATLGYSREHVFIYSHGKTSEDFIRCLLETFKRLGGKTKTVKTDNMSAVVSFHNGKRRINPQIKSFFDDLDVKLELCEIRSPETKGKCESANRFVNWIRAFDYQVSDEDELIGIIENYIASQCNSAINQSTGIPPAKLFSKEKDELQPLGNRTLLENYIREHKRQKVPSTLLISYRGAQYSVPKKYIGRVVDIYVISNQLYIYHNSSLITVHSISQKCINYKNKHYKEAISARLKANEDDINEIAQKNLNKLNRLGGD